MARTNFIDQGNALDGQEKIDIPAGRYGSFLLELRGTTAENQAGVLEVGPDIFGRLRLRRRNSQLQGQNFGFYHKLADLLGGYPASVLPVGGGQAVEMVAVVPVAFDGAPNSMDLADSEEADFILEFDRSLAGEFSELRYALHGILTPATPERYELLVEQQNIDFSGAGRDEETLSGKNVAQLYLENPDEVVDSVQVEVDGEVAVDNISLRTLNVLSNLETRIEGVANDLTRLSLVGSGSYAEAQNENVSLTGYTSGAGTLGVTTLRAQNLSEGTRRANVERARAWRRQRVPGDMATDRRDRSNREVYRPGSGGADQRQYVAAQSLNRG